MKTKLILTAMCLPLAFAACTNEELFVENQNALEDKPVVDFKVAATYGADGAESRMVNNNGTFLWDNTDVLGAVWNESTKIYSNNKFVNTLTAASASADFTTQATTVVGNYVFYYPYTTKLTNDLSKGIIYSLPEPQEYDPTGEKMMDNNFMISPNVKVDGNEPGELSLPLTMRSIYGYGLLNLTLPEVLVVDGSNVHSVKIQKIIIEYASNVYKNGCVNIANVPTVNLNANYIASLINGTKANPTNLEKSCKGKTEAEVRAILFNAADVALTAQNSVYANGTILNLTSGTEFIQQVSITCVSDENPTGVTLSKNETFTTRVLLPTTANAGAAVTIKVYTDKGVYEETTADARIKPNHTANLADLNRTSGETVIKMRGFSPVGNEIYAVSEADFIASIKQYKNTTVKVHVGDFSLTPAAIAAIPSTVTTNFQTSVTFEGDMTLKNMSFKNIVLKSGTIKLTDKVSGVTTSSELYPGVMVNAPAVINVKGANVEVTRAIAGKPIVNVKSGSFKVNATDANTGNPATTVLQHISVGTDGGSTSATLNVARQMNASNVEIYKNSVLNNASTITNDVQGLVIYGGATANNTGTMSNILNQGTLNNSGTIASGKNSGTINQMTENAKITLDSNYEGAVINTVAYSETTVTDNEGDINFVADARVKANGDVTYQAPANIKAVDFYQLPTAITKIVFGSDFDYTWTKSTSVTDAKQAGAVLPANVKTLQFKGSLKLSKSWELNEGSTIDFIGAKANITGANTLSNVKTIKAGLSKITGVRDAVPTKLYISTNTVVKTISNIILSGGATVWNDGVVYGTASNEKWGGNDIIAE